MHAAGRRDPIAAGARRVAGGVELRFNRSFQDRLPGIGVVDEDDSASDSVPSAPERGQPVSPRISGRAARASRTTGSTPSCRSAAAGDVQARVEQRALELEQTSLCWRVARRAIAPAATSPGARGAARSGSAGSRARAERRAASSSAATTVSNGCACAPGRMRIGRWLPSPPPTTCCPTSRSSTRASSSATPASTADAHASSRPPPAPSHHRPRAVRNERRALRFVMSTRARATGVSTSSRSSRARTTTSSGSGSASWPRRVTPTFFSSPAR